MSAGDSEGLFAEASELFDCDLRLFCDNIAEQGALIKGFSKSPSQAALCGARLPDHRHTAPRAPQPRGRRGWPRRTRPAESAASVASP